MNPICSTIDCGNPALPGYTMCADCAGQYEADRERIGRRMGISFATTAYMTLTSPVPALTAFTLPPAPITVPADEGTVLALLLNPDTDVAVPQDDVPAPLPFHLTHRALGLAIAFVVLMTILLYGIMDGGQDYVAAVQTVGTICLACFLMLYGSLWASGRHEYYHGLGAGEGGEDEA